MKQQCGQLMPIYLTCVHTYFSAHDIKLQCGQFMPVYLTCVHTYFSAQTCLA